MSRMAFSLPRRCVYVMRHGIKETNVAGLDNLALALTDEGVEALAELRAFFDAHRITFPTVLCSPFLRCRQTADALLRGAQVDLRYEPGLCEVLADTNGLRKGGGGAATVADVAARLGEQLDRGAAPLVALTELERDEDMRFMQCMVRSAKLVKRLSASHFADGPLLLVTHGGPAFGIIQALTSGGEVIAFDKARLPEMGSVTQLEEVDGSWRVVGSVVPVKTDSGVWECRWTRSAASGGEAAQL